MNDKKPQQITRIGSDECWRLLQRAEVGALATVAQGRPDLFPINYLVDGHTLLFRSAPGTKVEELEINHHAAFLAQGQDADGAWSVVLRGQIDMLTDQVEVVGSGALELVTRAPGSKRVFMRLTPSSVEGRRVPRSDLERSFLYG